jgi:hypothetical protein
MCTGLVFFLMKLRVIKDTVGFRTVWRYPTHKYDKRQQQQLLVTNKVPPEVSIEIFR